MKKKHLKLTETEVNEIITQMTEKYIQELSDNDKIWNDWFELDEEKLRELAESIDKEMLERKNLNDEFEYLVNCLDKPYPVDFVKTYIERICQLYSLRVQGGVYENHEFRMPFCVIFITSKATKEFIGLVIKKMEECGYFRSRKLNTTNCSNIMVLFFEPKFNK